MEHKLGWRGIVGVYQVHRIGFPWWRSAPQSQTKARLCDTLNESETVSTIGDITAKLKTYYDSHTAECEGRCQGPPVAVPSQVAIHGPHVGLVLANSIDEDQINYCKYDEGYELGGYTSQENLMGVRMQIK
jgi:hypothetical protein